MALLLASFSLLASVFLWSAQGTSSRKADHRIFESRIASTHATCQKFNDVQAPVADLIKVALRIPPRQDIPLGVQRKAIARFRHDEALLAPNACERQRKLLRRALRTRHYERSVPYRP
jgi:hypothetical protein